MRALVYSVLIALVLWVGFAWERAEAPLVAVNEKTANVPTPPAAESTEEVVVEALPASEPGPLVGSQDTLPVQEQPKQVIYDEAYVNTLELVIHALINEERVRAGLKAVEYDELLAQVAAYHSTDMAQEDYFAHKDEDGCDSACRVTSAGYKWQMVGENLFLLQRSSPFSLEGAAAIIVTGWMGSEGHRANILQEKFTYQGIGVVIKDDTIYATEVFARPR